MSGAPFTLWTQLGQLRPLDTPSFHPTLEAFRYADIMKLPEALSILATALMVAFGSLQTQRTIIIQSCHQHRMQLLELHSCQHRRSLECNSLL